MEVHRQRCQVCDSIDLRNLILRDEANLNTVFVRCARCGALVARYRLAEYYHHGKGFESWLRSYRGQMESGRALNERFSEISSQAVSDYEAVLAALEAQGKDLP